MDNLILTAFNTLNYINTSNSDNFKARATEVIKDNIPYWVNFLTLEYIHPQLKPKQNIDDEDEYEDEGTLCPRDIISNTLQIKVITKQDLSYIENLYTRVKLPPQVIKQILTTLFKQTIVYTNKDLVTQIKKATDFLNKNITSDYTGIVEYGTHRKNELKSKDWVFHEALNTLNKLPSCIIPYDKVKLDGVYVMMDDGIYSGTQVGAELKNLLKLKKKIIIYITVMYVAQTGIDLIERCLTFDTREENDECVVYTKDSTIIYFWKGYILIPSIPSVLKIIFDKHRAPYDESVIKDIHSNLLQNAGSIVLFEHKVPDYKSLPWIIANVFYINMQDHYINEPPYSPLSGNQLSKKTDYTFKCFNSFGSNLHSINKDIKYLNSTLI